MNRTPCFFAIAPSSCGSMMTKRDLSYAKCRSIKGSVPLPIEPKPIITMGPEIFAWICGAVIGDLRSTSKQGGARAAAGFKTIIKGLNQAARGAGHFLRRHRNPESLAEKAANVFEG